jgi:hypothetical protein
MERIPARSRAWQYIHGARCSQAGGDVGVRDQTARSHEMMPKLVSKLDTLAEDMRRASDGGRVLLRTEVKKLVGCMRGRSRYFANYIKKMATIQPAGAQHFVPPRWNMEQQEEQQELRARPPQSLLAGATNETVLNCIERGDAPFFSGLGNLAPGGSCPGCIWLLVRRAGESAQRERRDFRAAFGSWFAGRGGHLLRA